MAGSGLDVDSVIERLLSVRGQPNNRTVQLAEGEIRALCATARCALARFAFVSGAPRVVSEIFRRQTRVRVPRWTTSGAAPSRRRGAPSTSKRAGDAFSTISWIRNPRRRARLAFASRVPRRAQRARCAVFGTRLARSRATGGIGDTHLGRRDASAGARANPGAALDRARFSDLVWTRARRSRRRGGRRDARSRVRSSRERFQKSAPSRTAVSWSSSFFPSATRRARLRPFVPRLPRPPISRADVASIPPAPSSRSRRVFTGRFSSGSRACSSSRRR